MFNHFLCVHLKKWKKKFIIFSIKIVLFFSFISVWLYLSNHVRTYTYTVGRDNILFCLLFFSLFRNFYIVDVMCTKIIEYFFCPKHKIIGFHKEKKVNLITEKGVLSDVVAVIVSIRRRTIFRWIIFFFIFLSCFLYPLLYYLVKISIQ